MDKTVIADFIIFWNDLSLETVSFLSQETETSDLFLPEDDDDDDEDEDESRSWRRWNLKWNCIVLELFELKLLNNYLKEVNEPKIWCFLVLFSYTQDGKYVFGE